MKKLVDSTVKHTLKIRDNLTGQVFGRLTVEGVAYQKSNTTYYRCKCKCGKTKVIRGTLIKNRSIQSCGCLRKEAGKARKKHGLCGHDLYAVWSSMKARCKDKTNSHYGGRGIKVSPEWEKDFKCFYSWCMKNGYVKGLSLDRIDVNADYGPDNCRFITLAEQNCNKTNNKRYLYEGEELFLKDISLKSGVPESVLWYHLQKGKTVEEAIKQYIPRILIEDPVIYKRTLSLMQELWYLNKQLQIMGKTELEIMMLKQFPIQMVADVVERSQATLYRHKQKYSG